MTPLANKSTRAALAAGFLAALIGLTLVSGATGARSILLGKSTPTPKPNCPTPNGQVSDPDASCQVSGHVTGFQRSTSGRKGLFRVREDGKIVAWSVDLSRPSKEERDALGEAAATKAHGKRPTASIAIISRRKNQRFKLVRRSPTVELHSYYGQRPVITLDKPLRVRKGQIVAITTPTWLPNFAARNVSNRNVWVGSRNQRDFPDPNPNDSFRNECAIPDSVPDDEATKYFFNKSRPQTKVGGTRKYGCEYRGARLLYWAYLVPKRR